MADVDDLEQARRHYTQSQAETMELYGLNHSIGLLYGAMIFHKEPMTLEEMCQKTGMSKTSMSTGVRELSRLRLVRKVYQPGVRKDLYEVERNQFASFVEYFTNLWNRAVELNMHAIGESERDIERILSEDDLSDDIRQKAERDIGILERSKVYYNWLKQFAESVERRDLNVPMPDSLVNKGAPRDD